MCLVLKLLFSESERTFAGPRAVLGGFCGVFTELWGVCCLRSCPCRLPEPVPICFQTSRAGEVNGSTCTRVADSGHGVDGGPAAGMPGGCHPARGQLGSENCAVQQFFSGLQSSRRKKKTTLGDVQQSLPTEILL